MASYNYNQKLLEPKYHNWVKANNAVLCTQAGIEPFVCTEIQEFQLKSLDDICYNNGKVSGETCSSCCTENVVACPTRNICIVHHGRCNFHRNAAASASCPKDICHNFKNKIQTSHRYNGPSFKNTDATQWCSNPWEVAKCFMPPDGYKDVTCPGDTDFNGINSIIINHQGFKAKIKDRTIFETAKEIAKKVRHSPKHELDDTDLEQCFKVLNELLSDPDYLVNDINAKEARQTLLQIQNDELSIKSKPVSQSEDLSELGYAGPPQKNKRASIKNTEVLFRDQIKHEYSEIFSFEKPIHVIKDQTSVPEIVLSKCKCIKDIILEMSKILIFSRGLNVNVSSSISREMMKIINEDEITREYRNTRAMSSYSHPLKDFQDMCISCCKEIPRENEVSLCLQDVFIEDSCEQEQYRENLKQLTTRNKQNIRSLCIDMYKMSGTPYSSVQKVIDYFALSDLENIEKIDCDGCEYDGLDSLLLLKKSVKCLYVRCREGAYWWRDLNTFKCGKLKSHVAIETMLETLRLSVNVERVKLWHINLGKSSRVFSSEMVNLKSVQLWEVTMTASVLQGIIDLLQQQQQTVTVEIRGCDIKPESEFVTVKQKIKTSREHFRILKDIEGWFKFETIKQGH